jgi:nitroreductase
MSVLSTIKSRFSPYSFNGKNVPFSEIESAFEAARWANSGYNNQPWRFVFASRDQDNFENLLGFAVEANKKWMRDCGAIVAIFATTTKDANPKANESAIYCTGIAAGQMQIELTALGFQSHQVGGFDSEGLTEFLNLQDTLIPMAMMAIGKSSEEPKKDRERKPLAEIVIQ